MAIKGTIWDVIVLTCGVAIPAWFLLMLLGVLIHARRRRDKLAREVLALDLVMEKGMVEHDRQVGVGRNKLEPINVLGYEMSPGLQDSIHEIFYTPY